MLLEFLQKQTAPVRLISGRAFCHKDEKLTPGKKSTGGPRRGSSIQHRTPGGRTHYIATDVSEEEYQEIQRYCVKHKLSTSQFLAEVVLKDAASPNTANPKEKVLINATFETTRENALKLELLMRLKKKESISQFIQDILQPALEASILHGSLVTKPIRCYLTKEEHQKVMNRIAASGLSARNYAAHLALQTIRKDRKGKK